jgi:FMN-dependent oxidoreductase (nitrilotriacetate monooxygenase family)
VKELLVNAFYGASPSQSWAGLWQHPDAKGANYNTLEFWAELARVCEAGLVDGIFMADILALPTKYQGKPDAALRSGMFCPILDPMMLVPGMASVTSNLGFGITGNTTYEPAYLLARRFSTLDHLTQGRVAWNVVTGMMPSVAKATGATGLPPHDQRYDIADEYMEVCYRLWEECWDNDAVLRDKVNGIFTDPAKVRPINHKSEHFSCEGVHMVEPSRQRTPYIFSAGASGRGMRFAGTHAEACFLGTGVAGQAKQMVDTLRQAAVDAGRAALDIKIFNAATIVVADSDKEALELQQEMERYSSIEGNLAFLSTGLGMDLSQHDLDEPLEEFESDAIQSMVASLLSATDGKKPTLRDLAKFGKTRKSEMYLVGSANTVCDQLLDFVETSGIDGLNLVRTVEPRGIKAICDLVVPELQNRGAFKTSYREGTLREKMNGGKGAHVADTHPAATARAARNG